MSLFGSKQANDVRGKQSLKKTREKLNKPRAYPPAEGENRILLKLESWSKVCVTLRFRKGPMKKGGKKGQTDIDDISNHTQVSLWNLGITRSQKFFVTSTAV